MKKKLIDIINSKKQTINESKWSALKILAIVFAIILVGIIAICIKKARPGNSAGNSSNLGLAVQKGSWIYYIELENSEPVGICRTRTNGKNKENIAKGKMYELNVIGDYIYCIETNEENQNDLVKIKIDKKKKSVIVQDIDNREVIAKSNWIYYYKNNELYRIKTNGKKEEKISSKEIMYFHLDGNWIYYIYTNMESQYIARMKLDGDHSEKIVKISNEYKLKTLNKKGNEIYYVVSKLNNEYEEENYLCKVHTNGKKQEEIFKIDNNITEINMQEEEIYYTTTEDFIKYNVKSIKYNGTDRKIIKDKEKAIGINLTNKWIIYISENNSDSIIKMISKDGKKEFRL